MSDLHLEIKQLIIDALGLEDISTHDIGNDQVLFGEGLGLDSVDALELGLAIQKRYGIKIDADAKDTRNHFPAWTALRHSSAPDKRPEE